MRPPSGWRAPQVAIRTVFTGAEPMSELHAATRAFLDDERGATMVEYGIMLVFIAAVCILIITTLGGQTNSLFTSLNTAWSAA